MTDPLEPLIPEELSFDRRQLAELLHLLDRLQVRLGWDVDGMTSDPDDPEDR